MYNEDQWKIPSETSVPLVQAMKEPKIIAELI